MKLKKKMVIEIGAEEISEAIKIWLKNSGVNVTEGTSVEFKIKHECVGYGMAESEVVKFDGAKVSIVED